jgi:hypothetical protein
VRIDLLTTTTGVSWEEAWSAHVEHASGDTRLFVIGRDQFLKNKRTLGRLKDLLDAELIEPEGETRHGE